MAMNTALIIPMAVHVFLTAVLYAMVTIMRAPAVWKVGARADGSNPFAEIEKRASANLSNQFEWPLFFYVACLILLGLQDLYAFDYVCAAWVFIIGRMLHSLVQIFTNNIRLRGMVFCLNFLAVIYIWIRLLIDLL